METRGAWFRAYLGAVLRHLLAIVVTGAVPAVWVFVQKAGDFSVKLPLWAYALWLAVGLAFAQALAWRDLYRKTQQTDPVEMQHRRDLLDGGYRLVRKYQQTDSGVGVSSSPAGFIKELAYVRLREYLSDATRSMVEETSPPGEAQIVVAVWGATGISGDQNLQAFYGDLVRLGGEWGIGPPRGASPVK